jgi:hypothetical protein
MRTVIACAIAVFAMISLASVVRAGEQKTIKGVLIDQHCAKSMMKNDDPEAAAAKHEVSCALKCGPEAGYGVISGSKFYKFDADGNKLAGAYLSKKDVSTKVAVSGTLKDDGMLAVSDIKAQ